MREENPENNNKKKKRKHHQKKKKERKGKKVVIRKSAALQDRHRQECEKGRGDERLCTTTKGLHRGEEGGGRQTDDLKETLRLDLVCRHIHILSTGRRGEGDRIIQSGA